MVKPIDTQASSAVRASQVADAGMSTATVQNLGQINAVREFLTPLVSAALGSDELGRLLVNEIVRASTLTDASAIYAETPELGSQSLTPVASQATHNKLINQGNYKVQRLGDANSNRTISQSGCVLSSLTMATNQLTGAEHDPVSANTAIVAAGGFKGADMNIPVAAKALGLTVQSRDRATPAALAHAEEALDRGAKLLVGVDYKKGDKSAISAADHFLLVVGREGDNLKAYDPAGGREIRFHRDLDGTYRAGKYTLTEVSVLTTAKSTPAVPQRPLKV